MDQVPRVVAERLRPQQLQDAGQQRAAGGRVAADRQGHPARELGQGQLPGVAEVGGLGEPVGDIAEAGQVVEPEPGVSQNFASAGWWMCAASVYPRPPVYPRLRNGGR